MFRSTDQRVSFLLLLLLSPSVSYTISYSCEWDDLPHGKLMNESSPAGPLRNLKSLIYYDFLLPNKSPTSGRLSNGFFPQ